MTIDIGLASIIILSIPFVLFTIRDILKNKKIYYEKHFFNLIFFIYFINLLKYAIFPIYINSEIATIFQESMSLSEIIKSNVNLIPIFKDFNYIDFFLNILMTVPLGFILPCITKGLDDKRIYRIGLITGIGIELIQFILIFIQGFTFRNININDSIANFLGVLVGFYLFKYFIRFLRIESVDETNKSLNLFQRLIYFVYENNKEL